MREVNNGSLNGGDTVEESSNLAHLASRAEKLEHQSYSPQPVEYNIIVPSVPMWKIRSIACYKRLRYLQKMHRKRDGEAAMEGVEMNGHADRENSLVNKLMRDAPVPSKSEAGYGPPDPMLGLTIANKSMLQNLTTEELISEMGKMNFNCTLIRNEMVALERFRCNLVWMLEKSTMFKVQRNHNDEDLLLGTKGNPKKRYRSMTSSPEPGQRKKRGFQGSSGVDTNGHGGQEDRDLIAATQLQLQSTDGFR